MAKQAVRNASQGVRIVHHRTGRDSFETVSLQPGEKSREELDLDQENPVVKGMIKSGELVLGNKEVEVDQEERFRNDPLQRENRMIATVAGNTPGYADPLPDVDQAETRREAMAAQGRVEAAEEEEPQGGKRGRKARD